MREVQNKWSTLKMNDDIWAKLIYFEQNQRLAKAYVSAPVLTIDGSTSGLDGFRIGLSGIDNDYRSLDSIGALRSIGRGIKLRIDSQGNILIRKIAAPAATGAGGQSRCSVFVREWPQRSAAAPEEQAAGASVHELGDSDASHKLFDMHKFRLQLERRKLARDSAVDWRQCVSVISFVCEPPAASSGSSSASSSSSSSSLEQRAKQLGKRRGQSALLGEPCWLMLINVIAIDMLKSAICDTQEPAGKVERPLMSQRPPSELRRVSTSPGAVAAPRPSAGAGESSPHEPLPTGAKLRPLATGAAAAKSATELEEPAHHRRHRSQALPTSAALAANNVIYTTFNSKHMNLGKRSARLPVAAERNPSASSTSDYNSTSRSSNSGAGYTRATGYWSSNYRSRPSYSRNVDPYTKLLSSGALYRTSGAQANTIERELPSPASGRTLDSRHKSRSLSTFELGRRDQRPEFKLPSIKMHYDSVDRRQLEERRPLAAAKPNTKIIATVLDDDVDAPQGDSRRQVNHNHCRANLEATGMSGADKQQQQKVSRSSLGSSSSSGCVDNDYFLSNSSSSMSTSAHSNECELFSQPTSSSGIVGSGNTSDDCDRRRKPSAKSSKGVENQAPLSPSLNSAATKKSQQGGRSSRALKSIKTVELAADTLCDCGLDADCQHPSVVAHYEDCDCGCPMVDRQAPLVDDELDCDCCCDCLATTTAPPLVENSIRPSRVRGTYSKEKLTPSDPIYDLLPGRARSSPSARALDNSRRAATIDRFGDSRAVGRNQNMSRVSSLAHIGEDLERISPAPLQGISGDLRSASRNNIKFKETSSWLDKRKYMNILPKFVFGRSKDDNRLNSSQKDEQFSRGYKKFASTRLTRSTQNLT